jgi:Secretory lipase
VLLPAGRPRGMRPLLGYAIGTHGIGDAAAPSRLLPRGLEWEAALIAQALARGWAVAITDYEGLGTPGDHVYMVGRALGPNVLDSMRAARALAPEELPVGGPAAIIGYSEGGAAAAWAAQLQPSYAPEITLAGVAAGAAAADVETAGPNLERGFFSFFIAYGGIGYAAAYPELDLDSYLTPRARDGIAALRESTVLHAAVSGPHFARAADLTEPNVLELPEWRRRLRENRLGSIAPVAPVLLHHARRDQIVSFGQSARLRDDWCALGADVRLYVTRGGVEHISGAVAGTPVALDWLARRLARAKPSSTQAGSSRAGTAIASRSASEAA